MAIHNGIAMLIGTMTGLTYSDVGPANVFLDHMPDSPNRAVAVYTNAGDEADSKLPYDNWQCQVVVRSDSDEQWAIDTLMAIYSKLHGMRNTTLPDGSKLTYALGMQSSPFPLGDDENGRPQYSMDFRGEVLNPTEWRTG